MFFLSTTLGTLEIAKTKNKNQETSPHQVTKLTFASLGKGVFCAVTRCRHQHWEDETPMGCAGAASLGVSANAFLQLQGSNMQWTL